MRVVHALNENLHLVDPAHGLAKKTDLKVLVLAFPERHLWGEKRAVTDTYGDL